MAFKQHNAELPRVWSTLPGQTDEPLAQCCGGRGRVLRHDQRQLANAPCRQILRLIEAAHLVSPVEPASLTFRRRTLAQLGRELLGAIEVHRIRSKVIERAETPQRPDKTALGHDISLPNESPHAAAWVIARTW
jgi:hypothetical protein